jgi:hypothetical protein
VTRPIDIIRRINARQLAAERRSPSWPMNTIRRGLMITRSEPDMKIIHRSAEAESAESDRRNLGKPPPVRIAGLALRTMSQPTLSPAYKSRHGWWRRCGLWG